MKDYVKETALSLPVKFNVTMRAVLTQAAVMAAAFFMSRTSIFEDYLPLGLAAVAGVTPAYTVAAAFGAIVGYFFPVSGAGVFKYVTAVFAIASIKWLVFGAIRVKNTPLLFAFIALAASLATGFATLMGNYDPTTVIMTITESLLAAGGAFFINKALLLRSRITAGISGQELATVVIAANLVLISLIPLSIGSLSIGRAVLVAVVLCAARYGGAPVGAVAGTAAGFAVSLSGGSAVIAAMPFAVGGLLSGVFSAVGKIASAALMILSFGLWVVMSGGDDLSVAMLIEAAAGSVIFLLLPAKVGNFFAEVFSPSARLPKMDGLRKSLVMRLNFASEAMSDVSETVEKVSERLARTTAPEFEDVLGRTEQAACAGCSLRLNCWENCKGDTLEAILQIVKAHGNGVTPEAMTDEDFTKKCLRFPKLCESAIRFYDEYMSRQMAAERLSEVRSVVTDQFYGISEMLDELASEFERAQIYDLETASEIVSGLKRIGVLATECGCCTDKYGRMSIEIRIKDTGNMNINRRDILRIVEEVCDRNFDPPSVIEGKKEYLVSISEKAVYTVDYGAAQYSCGEGRMCGDAYEFFGDGRGRSFMILSDGMGTGGRAAVDGAMASGLISRLIKSGFGFDCALKIVNSAMLFKSTDESFATIDVTCMDLFTGKTEFYKAGAAPTIVRKGNKTARAECSSLPAGILKDVGFDKASVTLGNNDVVVMISDGAAGENTDWICAELEAWQDGNASSLAEHIASAARRRRNDGHEDDVTVLAAIIAKAG